jgi:hypothetical protein
MTLSIAILLLLSPNIFACMGIGGPGFDMSVLSEEAVIVWDARSSVEHFIRRAQFRSNQSQFAFVVPTPTPPKLAEVNDSIFTQFNALLIPKIVTRGYSLQSIFFQIWHAEQVASGMGSEGTAMGSVMVLESTHVAGYDAVVLQADDSLKLRDWLNEHGYQMRPAAAEWLEPYVQKHWTLTAFKIGQRGAGSTALSTPNVDIVFKTDRPFYPYREPADAVATPGRDLKIFLVASSRMVGVTGAIAKMERSPWAARVLLAVPQDLTSVLAPIMMGAKLPENARISVFDDAVAQRPTGDDLFFKESPDQSEILIPPVIQPHIIYVERLLSAVIALLMVFTGFRARGRWVFGALYFPLLGAQCWFALGLMIRGLFAGDRQIVAAAFLSLAYWFGLLISIAFIFLAVLGGFREYWLLGSAISIQGVALPLWLAYKKGWRK